MAFSEVGDATTVPRADPSTEQAGILEKRLAEAQEHMERGAMLVRSWTPVARSCKAGLEALQRDDPESAGESYHL